MQTVAPLQSQEQNNGGDSGAMAAQRGDTRRTSNGYGNGKYPHIVGTTSTQRKGSGGRHHAYLAEDGVHRSLLDVNSHLSELQEKVDLLIRYNMIWVWAWRQLDMLGCCKQMGS